MCKDFSICRVSGSSHGRCPAPENPGYESRFDGLYLSVIQLEGNPNDSPRTGRGIENREMKLGSQVRLIACCVVLSSSLFAAKITGKVTNGTTNKPAAGSEVLLLSLAGGMDETGRTRTDAKGGFSVPLPNEARLPLIEAVHHAAKD